jgi:ribosomal protein S12 methylthiotransferase
MKVGFITLGCDKNTVDTERYLAQLVAHGAQETSDLDEAEVIIVNTCGFIDAAKRESIDAIVQAGQYKTDGACQAVIAVGCMVQRHKSELEEALPEVDVFLGSSEMDQLVPALVERGVIGSDPLGEHPGVRVYSGDLPHVRYLKISEGCDHGCAFCAIPLMRGKHRSFSLDELVREAQLLELQGAREVNLVAQDLAHYGRDRRDGVRLPELLEALLRETSIPWLRNLYLYSTGITPRLLEVIAANPRIVRYLDMPMQHASDAVLERMRRPERQRTIREKVARFRDAVPNMAIRTTCIVGFPGETEGDFETLLEFLEETRFDRVGAFTYSPQEGTRAFDMTDDVPESVKQERLERLSSLQRSITAERYEGYIGSTTRVLVDRAGEEPRTVIGRAAWQADDIDGVTVVRVAPGMTLAPGTFLDARIDEVVDDFDFVATLERVTDAPLIEMARRSRSLPMVALTGAATASSIGSFGR